MALLTFWYAPERCRDEVFALEPEWLIISIDRMSFRPLPTSALKHWGILLFALELKTPTSPETETNLKLPNAKEMS